MQEGLLLAYASMQKYFVTPGKSMEPLWKDENGKPRTRWMFWLFAPGQPEAGFTHETETEVLVDDRAAKYFYVTYLPKYLGGGTFYLTGLFDSNGDMYDGKSTYRLNVPKDTPAKDFWSVIVYSIETKNFIRVEDVRRSSVVANRTTLLSPLRLQRLRRHHETTKATTCNCRRNYLHFYGYCRRRGTDTRL